MCTSRSRAVGHGGLISLLAAFIIIAMPAGASADENKVTVTIGKPGDRWLDAMQFQKVARARREKKQFGYEVTYLLPGLGEHTLFWPRSKIDLDGSEPRNYRMQVMKLEQGRLFLPDRITSESLPDVYRAILSLEGSYLKAARGDLAAAEAFTNVVILAGTRSGRGSSLVARSSTSRTGASASVKPTAAKPTAAKPTAAKPTAAKPTAAKPTAAKPTAAKPSTAKPTQMEAAATSTAAASTTAKGSVLEGANFAQKTYSPMFSRGGAFAGKSVDDVAAALRSGAMKPSDVPINYIVRDGNTIILNTRSAQALEAAGIPRSAWKAVNRTGQEMFENMLTGQLQRNGLTSAGTATVRRSGM